MFGADLNISDPMFDGHTSYMAFHHPPNLKLSLSAQLQFKPASLSGLLLYAAEHLSEHTSDFMAVLLEEGHVQLRYNTGTLQPTVIQSLNALTNHSLGRSFWYLCKDC